MERINWKNAYKGSKSNVKPDAFMLADGGKVVISLCRKDGDKNIDPPMEREVVYDRDYVISKLSKDTLFLILGLSKADYISLFESVWESKQRLATDGFPVAHGKTRQRFGTDGFPVLGGSLQVAHGKTRQRGKHE